MIGHTTTLKGMLVALLTFGCFIEAPAARAPGASMFAPDGDASSPDARSDPKRQSHSSVGQITPPAEVPAPITAPPVPALSPQADQVSRIAEQNGDQNYLMIDKARGEIILFENGRPTFSGAALTGESLADRIPPKVLAMPNSHHFTTDQKVTPAGRFSVRPELDPEYGRVWTITEIHGKDWDFAIHRVWLGAPSEHRDVRLLSSDPLDRHITFGCINVERSTIQLLTQRLPRKGTIALYILPQDEATTVSFFPLRASATGSLVRSR